MNAGELRRHQVDEIEDKVSFEVCGVDNQNLRSHAGIFISINGKKLVGGEPFEALELQKGKSADEVLLDIRKSIAKLASRNIKTL